MAFTDVFGGELLFPSQLSYLSITTAVDVTLQWPTEQQITGGNVVADFLDINTTAPALNIDFPDARNTSEGNKSTVNNVGGNDFTVRDATGGVIQFVGTGEQWVLVLTDNSTEAGVWSAFQLGAATTLASASALAGAGLQADGFGMLEQIIDSDVEASTPIPVVDGDRAKCLIYTAGAGVADLPSAGTVGNNWFFMLRNSGSGTLAVTPPSGNIDGSSSINLDPGDSAFIFTDGTDYFTIGLSTGSTIAFDFVSLPIPGSGDFVLSGANLNRISYRFTGALTGNRKVVVPDTTQQYWCDNQTTGAFVLSIGTAAQASPPTLDAGTTAIFYCDSTDVIDAVNAVSVSFPILITQGGTSASDAPTAVANLGALPVIVDLTVAVPAGGDFLAFQDIDDANNNKRATIDDILANSAGVSQLVDSGGNIRVRAETGGIAQLRSVANTDAEDRLLNLTHQDGTVRGFLGYESALGDELVIKNSVAGGEFKLKQEIFGGGGDITFLDYDANGTVLTLRAGLTLTFGFDSGDTAFSAQDNSFSTMRFNNIESIRTRVSTDGGAGVTNLFTGAGDERILSDPGDLRLSAIQTVSTFTVNNSTTQVTVTGCTLSVKVQNNETLRVEAWLTGQQNAAAADLKAQVNASGTASLGTGSGMEWQLTQYDAAVSTLIQTQDHDNSNFSGVDAILETNTASGDPFIIHAVGNIFVTGAGAGTIDLALQVSQFAAVANDTDFQLCSMMVTRV